MMTLDELVQCIYNHGDPKTASAIGSATVVQVPFRFAGDDQTLFRLAPRLNAHAAPRTLYAPFARLVFPNLILRSDHSNAIIWLTAIPLDGEESVGLLETRRVSWLAAASILCFDPDTEVLFPAQTTMVCSYDDGIIGDLPGSDRIGGDGLAFAAAIGGEAARFIVSSAIPHRATRPFGEGGIFPLSAIVGTTMALLCCKNVRTVDIVPSRQVRRAALRERRPLPFTVKKLIVTPFGKSKGSKGSTAVGDGDIALHWVRGHFKSFSEDKPLFGKVVGTFWWTPHLAGDVENGLIVKDYELRIAAHGRLP